jgi:primosomal protein N' (replication factor Y)
MPPVVRVASVEGAAAAVSEALAQLRAEVPALGEAAVLGPVPTEEGAVRALVRFEYGQGRAVADTLRSAVVTDALQARRSSRDRGGRSGARGSRSAPRSTLRVRLDVPELDL